MPTRNDHEQLDDRKAAILKSVVTGYVETAQPVGSSQVARDPVIEVSPATVRADMAALEREGYLTHPHTSAGRVPTDKGYRFFVDHLGNPHPLARAEHEQVQVFFSKAHGELERVLQDTSRLLAELTDCAAVVVSPAHQALVVRSALIARLAARTAMVVAVLSNGSWRSGRSPCPMTFPTPYCRQPAPRCNNAFPAARSGLSLLRRRVATPRLTTW